VLSEKGIKGVLPLPKGIIHLDPSYLRSSNRWEEIQKWTEAWSATINRLFGLHSFICSLQAC